MKGVIHFHSNFSYDGHNSIEEIVAFLKERGCSFLFLTEHDDDFDDAKMKQFVDTCDRVSSQDFLVVPGIEFRCRNKVHILGLGLKDFLKETDPIKVSKRIRLCGGKVVIAHPVGYMECITHELLKLVDGVEIWNGYKDSKFTLNPFVVNKFVTWKKINPRLVAVCGGDHHSIIRYFPLEIHLPECPLKLECIWSSLTSEQVSFSGALTSFNVTNIVKRQPLLLVMWIILERLRKIRELCMKRETV